MTTIQYEGLNIELDEDGFLKNFDDWNEKVACAIADKEGVSKTCPLTEEKMEILRFIREYYKKFFSVPIPHFVCKNVNQSNKCEFEEFPDPLRAWKIAGLPRPVLFGELFDTIEKRFK
ncbi:MAG: TusE/DsrC/DsvC family sulfur relay protein [Deltaproteobacteria bacterium]|nr:MAG: TusE/DsrC/DsvC family sulfur relay protein [Deltaproteobacteria bacterium]